MEAMLGRLSLFAASISVLAFALVSGKDEKPKPAPKPLKATYSASVAKILNDH